MAKSKFNRTNQYRANEHENSGVQLHDSNINQYLSELEEYANIILIYKEKMNNEAEDVFSKNLLLDELQPKQFKKKTYVFLAIFRITVPFIMYWMIPKIRQKDSKKSWSVNNYNKWRGKNWRKQNQGKAIKIKNDDYILISSISNISWHIDDGQIRKLTS